MCQAVDDLELELITRGKKQGLLEGERKGERRGKKQGLIEGELKQKFKTIKIMLENGFDFNALLKAGFTKREVEQAMNL